MHNVKEILSLYDTLTSKRTTMLSLWQEIEKMSVPFSGKFDGRSVDPYKIHNDTVFRAINILKSGLYSYLTNPASRWFVIDSDSDIESDKILASKATDSILKAFRMSNLYPVLDAFYRDMITYGTAAIYEEEDINNDGLRFMALNPKTFVFDKDVWGKVNRVIIELGMTAGQVKGTFGEDNVSDTVKRMKDNESVQILLYVGKNYDKKLKKPYVSLWIEKEKQNVLREGSYNSMPVFVGQWSNETGHLYCSSPAIDAYATIQLANRITKSYWLNNEKVTNPPLDVPYDGYVGDIDISPSAINYRTTNNPNDRIVPIMTTGNINVTMESVRDVDNAINEKFFVDLFLMGETQQMTATEVIQRNQEKMLLLGAVVGKITNNVLKPLIERSLNILVQSGIIKNIGQNMRVEFLSQLAQTQKSSEYSSLVVLLNTALQIAQVDASVVDNINFDEFIRKVGDIYSVPPQLFTDSDEMNQIRQQRQQVQMEQLKIQLGEVQSKAQKNQAQASLNIKKGMRI